MPGKLRMLASLEDYRRLVERMLKKPRVTLQDVIMCNGGMAHVSRLSPVKAQRLETYRALFPEAVVADLTQNPEARHRCGRAEMPTLTRACTSLVHIPTGHIYGCVSAFSRGVVTVRAWCGVRSSSVRISAAGPLELAALHGMPVTLPLATALRVSVLQTAGLSDSALCSCAP